MAARTVSQTTFARRHGVSRQAVHQAAAEGRVPRDPGGRIPLKTGDRAWRDNVTPRPRRGKGNSASPATLTEARRRLAAMKAELVEVQLAKARGELVPAADVRRDAFNAGRSARDRVLGFPARVAPLLVPLLAPEHTAVEVEAILQSEADAICEHMAEMSTYGRPKRTRTGRAGA